jgi:3-hydroxymyristoyl/3-hydroxydecanoyl-(acyl carrier protein) dehydratase
MIDTQLSFALEVEEDRRREYSMNISADSPYFRGHFPNHPVLPGVAQLEAIVLELALQSWPDLGSLMQVRRLKFRRVIKPNTALRLQLLRQKEGQIKFTLSLEHEAEECCTGTLCFGERRDVG